MKLLIVSLLLSVVVTLMPQSVGAGEDEKTGSSSAPDGGVSTGDPQGVLALADAIALALTKNPDLAAFSWDVRAAEARQIQARLRPNPELAVELEDVRLGPGPSTTTTQRVFGASLDGLSLQTERGSERGSGGGLSEAQFTISLSQLIELGGKRARRIELAAWDRDVSAWDYEVARADVLKDTAQAFVAVLAAQERVALDGSLVQLAEQVLSTVQARVNAGRVSPLEGTKAETALRTAQVQANASRGSLEAARTDLAALWGETEARFDRAEGRLEDVRPVPPLDEISGRISGNPDLSRWRAEIEKRQSAVTLEKSKAVSDVTVSAGFRTRGVPEGNGRSFGFGSEGISFSEGGGGPDRDWENLVVVGVSVPLPLFNRNQGAILESEHMASKAGDERHSVDVKAHAALSRGYQDLSTAYATLSSLRDSILPAATQTFESINKAYGQGKFGYLDVLDAQRTLFEARQQYLDALAAYHRSVAEVERTIGEPLWKSDESDTRPGKGK